MQVDIKFVQYYQTLANNNYSRFIYPPYVIQTDVRIERGEESYFYHDCRENVLRNFFNNLLYTPYSHNQYDGFFDTSLLAPLKHFAKEKGNSTLIDKIISFYTEHPTPAHQGIIVKPIEYDVGKFYLEISDDEEVLDEAATKWCELLSSLRAVTYWWPKGRYPRPFELGDTHEINAGLGNYLRVFSYIFGLIDRGEGEKDEVILTLQSLEDHFREVQFNIQFIPNAQIPLPNENLSQPATLDHLQGDNHDLTIGVVIQSKPFGNRPLELYGPLKFSWVFTKNHLEVYFTSKNCLFDHSLGLYRSTLPAYFDI